MRLNSHYNSALSFGRSALSKVNPTLSLIALVLVSSPTYLNGQATSSLDRPVANNTPSLPTAPSVDRSKVLEEYGRLPLSFEVGPDTSSATFAANTAGGNITLSAGKMLLLLQSSASGAPSSSHEPPIRFGISLEGANAAAKGQATNALPGKTNYFIGPDPAAWRRDVPNFGQVEYSNVYPGVDLVYYGNRSGRLEHDFIVKAGADPQSIKLKVDGGLVTQLTNTGNLSVTLRSNENPATATLIRPVIYQQTGSTRVEIAGSYVLNGSGEIAFQIGDYDHSRDLIIDPVLDYSTFLGGGILTGAMGIAADASGNAYVVGHTGIGGFPTTSGSYDPGCDSCSAAFVAKLNPTGTALLYSTYLSGGLFDQANSVAVDSSGEAYVAGITASSGFPVTKGAVQTKFGGAFSNAFVTKLNSAGSELEYSTFLGGNGPSTCYRESVGAQADMALGIAIDTTGDAYVTGCTSSTNFPVTSSAPEKTCKGCAASYASAFVAKLNPSGTKLLYSTYLGGNGLDLGYGIAVNTAGDAFVTGSTTSTNLAVTSDAYQKHLNASGGQNAFVIKLNSSGTDINYYTYLGGKLVDGAFAIAIDSVGHAYIGGTASSTNFPTTSGAYQRTCHDCANFQTGFATELNEAGSGLVLSTFLGGSGSDYVAGIAVNTAGDIFVTGGTESKDFPTTGNALKRTCTQCDANNSLSSGFFSELSPSGTALTYSTYLGGSSSDSGSAIALDSAGNGYVVGTATSAGFPISAHAAQTTCSACSGGDSAAFVTKFYNGTASPKLAFSPTSLSFGNQALKHTSASKTITITNSGGAPLQVSGIKYTGTDPGDFGGTQTCGAAIPAGISCSVKATFDPQALGARSATLEVSDNESGSPQKLDVTGTGIPTSPKADFSSTSVSFGKVVLNTEVEATLTLTNTGTATLAVTAASITGTGEANFGGNTNCGQSITPGSSCTFTLAFEPLSAKTYDATLNVTTNASKTPVAIPLSGTGVPDTPSVQVSPTTLTFSTESVGSSATKTVTLTNTGAAYLMLSSITISGADASNFSAKTTCSAEIAPGAKCTETVTFKPTKAGTRTATLNFTDDASGSPQKVALSGTGK